MGSPVHEDTLESLILLSKQMQRKRQEPSHIPSHEDILDIPGLYSTLPHE
eukprot:CAMPEP_0178941822 /NCGR_PEP_ID=MMETSP0789-20121207/1631_1 /TAXON_ID=3005 /ORGANISM="Rhizosolenia setigera, Strain CCMP 1694" /LENGTH=49 /DNA_ID=CAMNT_0020621121 /DNA_START=364 /DNA_END=513 /DNA_ORIENTATION=+